jgi:multidrug efflux pump subunit AcrA (membrane-fusion protein)
MRSTGISRGFFLSIVFWSGAAFAQTLPTAARIESVPLELTMPERYHVSEVLEPIRKVTLVAAADGLIRSTEGRLGEVVRESQEIAQIDRAESAAKLKMATAELHEKQALLKSNKNSSDVYQAQVEAAEARVELAQLDLDRCTLRAPFSGRLVALNVCTGQYVLKGTAIAELADVSSLKVMQPLDRRSVNANSAVTVQVEGRDVAAKVQAVLPLPEGLRLLRELATPFGAATLIVPNSKGDLEPGQRVHSPNLPSHPIATVPKRAVKPEDSRGGENMMVQVIRDEYVTNVPIRVLGENGSERVQISGALRASDSLIASTSVPLLPGTLVRFGENGTGRPGDGDSATPATGGAEAGITGPAGGRARTPATGSPANAGTSKRRPTQSGRSAAGGSPF